MHVRGGEVLTARGLVTTDLVIRNGKVAAFGAVSGDGETIDATGLLVAPGFIDLQCNGAHGIDLASEPERIDEVSAVLPRYGVTAWLPTIITSPPEIPLRAMAALRAAADRAAGATPVSLHMEGPMLSPARKGAHPEALLKAPSAEVIDGWSREAGVALVTLAPELPGGLEVVKTLVDRGVVVAAGHSAASAEEARAAADAGVTVVTHLGNGMNPLHHREPGLVGAALADERLAAGLIADGIHLHPVMVAAAWRALRPDRLVLVSDAVGALGLGDGRHRLGDQEVTIGSDGVRLAGGDSLAGSNLSMDEAVRNLMAFTGCSAAEAIACATSTPARLLGLTGKGRIEVGADADLVLLDEQLGVVATIVGGELVFHR